MELPAGSCSKGYRDFVVQDLRIAAHNTLYRLDVTAGSMPTDASTGNAEPGVRTLWIGLQRVMDLAVGMTYAHALQDP